MKRDNDTSYFTFDTTSKYKNQRSADCVVRAISLAENKTWTEVFDALSEIAKVQFRMPNEQAVFTAYLKTLGYTKFKAPRTDGNRRVLAKDFAIKSTSQIIIANVGAHHLSVFINGKIHDTWNCGDKAVGNYWIKNL